MWASRAETVAARSARRIIQSQPQLGKITMQDDLAALFAYDRWANQKVFDACRTLTAEQYVAEPVPGWSSVRSTIVHIAIVTEGWVRGLTGETVGHPPAE